MHDEPALLGRALGRDVVSVERRALHLGSAFGDLQRWVPTYADGGAGAPASVIAKTPKSAEIRQLGDGLGPDPNISAARFAAVINQIETGVIPSNQIYNVLYRDLVTDVLGTVDDMYQAPVQLRFTRCGRQGTPGPA